MELKNFLNLYSNDQFNLSEMNRQLTHEGKNLDKILIDLCKIFIYIYKDFKLPMRFVCLNAHELKPSESFKIEMQVFLPSMKNYQTVSIFFLNLICLILIK